MAKKIPKIPVRAGYRAGLDENGLGPRLGPLVVTAAHAQLTDEGAAAFARKLPVSIQVDLNDSKALVSCHDYSLAEAWAWVLYEQALGKAPQSPEELLQYLCPESESVLRLSCPKSTLAQCWNTEGEVFVSDEDQRARILGHVLKFASRGMQLLRVRSEVVCTGKLNQLKGQGIHRFAADLHAMERLILSLVEERKAPLIAVCGKVGGIGKYEPFFGPLGDRLRTVLVEGQAQSGYYFPQVGEIYFVRDADATDPLVMLASLVGKYVRELLMGRIARYYGAWVEPEVASPSGYHDPVTTRFVEQTEKARRKLKIVGDCFERRPAADG